MPNLALRPKRNEYYVQTGSMFENPYGVPHDEIVSQLLEMPVEVAAQVIFGKYVESDGLVFTGPLIQMLFDRVGTHYPDDELTEPRVRMPRITGDFWVDQQARRQAIILRDRHRADPTADDPRRRRFHNGVDFARETDWTVIFTLDVSVMPARVVYFRRVHRVPWESIYREVGRVAALFGTSGLGDATSMAGDVIFDALAARHYCPKHDRNFITEYGGCVDPRTHTLLGDCREDWYVPLNYLEPFQFATNSKKQLIEHLRNTMGVGFRPDLADDEEFGWLRCPPIVQLEEELAFYAWMDKGLETDCVMALALAAWKGLIDVPGPSAVGSPHGA